MYNTEDVPENSRYASRVVNDPLAVIYNQVQWRISRVSALYNLEYNTVKLKQYASKIKQNLISTITSNSKVKYAVSVGCEPKLRYSEDDAEALVITIYSSIAESKSKPKTVYEALLLSWGVSCSVPNAVHLPYMLERGEQRAGNAVKSSLGTIFDCTITPYSFSQQHLLNLGLNFIDTETSNSDKKIGFIFLNPQSDCKDKLTINLEVADVYMIWNVVKEETNNQEELVFMTYQALQNQIYSMFELDITALLLSEVNLPQAGIKAYGTVKIKTADMVNSLFTGLNKHITDMDIEV